MAPARLPAAVVAATYATVFAVVGVGGLVAGPFIGYALAGTPGAVVGIVPGVWLFLFVASYGGAV